MLLLAALLSAARRSTAEATLDIVLDQATLMKLPEKVSTIVIGNPLIADVAVQSGGLVVVTGKGYGSTNLIALDRSGTVLLERSIVVRGPRGHDVVGLSRRSSARPIAARRTASAASRSAIPPTYFAATAGQADARNSHGDRRQRPRPSAGVSSTALSFRLAPHG